MWEFDEDGEMYFEKCVQGFLPDLFTRWKEVGTNHVVSIVLFARVLVEDSLVPFQSNNVGGGLQRDIYGRFCRDFYRVIVDWESRQDWNPMLGIRQ
jgi:hypothetical protein